MKKCSVMKTMKRIFLGFLAVALLASCNKKQETHTVVTGKVTERNTDTPVAGALIKLVSLTKYTYNTVESIEDTARTDENGNYTIEAEVHTENELMLYATDEDQYYPNDETDLLKANVQRGKNQNLDFSIVPFGWVRIHAIKDQGNDGMHINRLIGAQENHYFSSTGKFLTQTYGNSEVKIYFFIDKGGQQVDQGVQLVTTIGHDTVDIDIHF